MNPSGSVVVATPSTQSTQIAACSLPVCILKLSVSQIPFDNITKISPPNLCAVSNYKVHGEKKMVKRWLVAALIS